MQGSDPTPVGKYTAEEVKALGERDPPLALKLPNGTYGYPIASGSDALADLSNALAAYKDPQFDNYDGLVRPWIVSRAIAMKRVDALPTGWAEPKYKPHPNEVDDGDRAQSDITEPAKKCTRCAGPGRVGLGAICPRCSGVGRVRPFSASGTVAPGGQEGVGSGTAGAMGGGAI